MTLQVRKQYAYMQMSRELRIDAGIATAEEIAASRAEFEARKHSRRLALGPRYVRRLWSVAAHRVAHALAALHGIECERDS